MASCGVSGQNRYNLTGACILYAPRSIFGTKFHVCQSIQILTMVYLHTQKLVMFGKPSQAEILSIIEKTALRRASRELTPITPFSQNLHVSSIARVITSALLRSIPIPLSRRNQSCLSSSILYQSSLPPKPRLQECNQ